MSCLCCLRCRRTRERFPPDDDESEDSELYWIRRHREEQQRQKTRQRNEFLENVLRTKTIVVETENGMDASSDEFIIPHQSEMCCAICLLQYGQGDLVSFSHNPSCQHHFHRECIMSWLKENNACPCCRQDYLSFGDDNEPLEGEEVGPREIVTFDHNNNINNNNNNDRQEDENHGIAQHVMDQLYGTGIFQSSIVPRENDPVGASTEVPPETRRQWIRTIERLTQHIEVPLEIRQLQERLNNLRQSLPRQPVQEQMSTSTSSRAPPNPPNEERGWERSVELVRHQVDRWRTAVIHEIQHRRDRDHMTHTTDQDRRRESRSAAFRLEDNQRDVLRPEERLGQAIQAMQSSVSVHAGRIVDSIRNHREGSMRASTTGRWHT